VNHPTKVLLITGPAGSGKSTLAQHTADQLGWLNISEDEYWVKNGWRGHRTEEQEHRVQKQVSDNLLHALREGSSVVLEFILYKQPPNPLTNYQRLLSDSSIQFRTVVLKPSVDEIKQRLMKRGRPNDIARIDERMTNVVSQLSILEADFIDPDWVIDPTTIPVEELYAKCLQKIES
jgi:adenylate kinase family enzyme